MRRAESAAFLASSSSAVRLAASFSAAIRFSASSRADSASRLCFCGHALCRVLGGLTRSLQLFGSLRGHLLGRLPRGFFQLPSLGLLPGGFERALRLDRLLRGGFLGRIPEPAKFGRSSGRFFLGSLPGSGLDQAVLGLHLGCPQRFFRFLRLPGGLGLGGLGQRHRARPPVVPRRPRPSFVPLPRPFDARLLPRLPRGLHWHPGADAPIPPRRAWQPRPPRRAWQPLPLPCEPPPPRRAWLRAPPFASRPPPLPRAERCRLLLPIVRPSLRLPGGHPRVPPRGGRLH